MNTLIGVLKELGGLFVEDGAFALAIAAVVATAALCAFVIPRAAPASGAVLLLGCLGVLVMNVMRAPHRHSGAERSEEPGIHNHDS